MLALTAACAASAEAQFCSLAGCAGDEQVELPLEDFDVALPTSAVYELCGYSDDDARVACTTVMLDAKPGVLLFDLKSGTPEEVSRLDVSIRDADDGSLAAMFTSPASFEMWYPNGPDCPPVCWGTAVRWMAFGA